MKVRSGFVSNSSSSSFLIYGAKFEKAPERVKQEDVGSLGIEHGDPDWDDTKYVGLSWSAIKDDETGAQFKSRIENELKKLFPDEKLDIGTWEDAWYNG